MYKITNITKDPRRINLNGRDKIIAPGESIDSNILIEELGIWKIDGNEKTEKRKTKSEVKEHDSNRNR